MAKPLYEKIYQNLLESIRNQELKPGDRVPSEKELAEQFGVSRITSKGALEKLAQAGLIERIRGKGSFVSSSLPDLDTLPTMDGETPKTERKTAGVPHTKLREQPPLVAYICPEFSDQYGADILRTIEEYCSLAGMNLIVRFTRGSREIEEKAIKDLVTHGVDGIIISPVHAEYYNPSLLRLILDGFPVVLVGGRLGGIPASAVFTDSKKASQDLARTLFEKGHRRIAFVSTQTDSTPILDERLQGYLDACTREGEGVQQNDVISNFGSGEGHDQSGQTSEPTIRLKHYIELNPDVMAFMVQDVEEAQMLLHALRMKENLSGTQYAIGCFECKQLDEPTIFFACVKEDEVQMGQNAVELLQQLLHGGVNRVQRTIPHCILS